MLSCHKTEQRKKERKDKGKMTSERGKRRNILQLEKQHLQGTKSNLVTSMENKIKKLRTEKKERERLEERLWSQIIRNGYGK